MTNEADLDARIDRFIAAAMRGERNEWPAEWSSSRLHSAVAERVRYHGVSGLLVAAGPEAVPWPEPVRKSLRQAAIGQTIWEMRHRPLLSKLLAAFADRGVEAIVLKGSALAYDIYSDPATRARGDTDVLVAPAKLAEARAVLGMQGFVRDALTATRHDDIQLQEVWQFVCAVGTRHHIDLHWQTLNSPALEGVLTAADCMVNSRTLPRLCEAARTLDRVPMMIHLTAHRAAHISSPYFLGSTAYYGGDRLIWAKDIALLAETFSGADWSRLCDFAASRRVGQVCLDGLKIARDRLGVEIPPGVLARLEAMPRSHRASAYLLEHGQLARSWRDFLAVRGWRPKLSYLALRVFPSGAFMRAKYPGMAAQPLVSLYLRRLVEFAGKRPPRSQH